VLLGVAYAVSNGYGRLDAFEAGQLGALSVRHGEWWRAITALTLHLDAAHIGANLAAGVWFGYLCGRLLGPGISWALIVLGAGCANLGEALLAPAGYTAVGASTAVFTALGLLASYSWRDRYRLAQRWALRWAPLVAGVLLLAWTGTAGENTDVVAHLGGFGLGAVLGALAATPGGRQLLRRTPQWLAGALALAAVFGAWACALWL
jgi:membrane associated rhomboid family serine protease